MSSRTTQNLGRLSKAILVEDYGFQTGVKFPFFLYLQTDDQHALCVSISPWTKGRQQRAGFNFGIARRDNNELRQRVMQPDWETWNSVVFERGIGDFHPKVGDAHFLPATHTAADIADWLGTHIPILVEHCANLPFIKQKLEEYKSQNFDQAVGPLTVEAMLDGWTNEAETEIMESYWLKSVAEATNTGHQARMQDMVDLIRSWIDEHPDGVERDLTS